MSNLGKVQTSLIALTPFIKICTLFFANRGMGNMASQLGSLIIYASILVSFIVLTETNKINRYIKYVYRILFVYIIIFACQKLLTPQTSLVNSHINNFVLIGIGAFTIGYSLTDIQGYIRKVGIMSIMLGLIFLFEPINNALLAEKNMSTGYTLAPLCIYGLLYSLYTPNKIIKLLAILPCITVSLFTSRGCGLSIISFYLLALILKNKYSFKKSIVLLGISLLVMWGIFSFALSYGGLAAEGSVLGKFLSGDIASDNGREYLLELGWMLVGRNPLTGLGIDGDIAILNGYIEDYPFIHNVLVELFMDYGIPMAIALLLLYFVPIIRTLTAYKTDSCSLLLIAMLCAVWIRLLFSDSYINNLFNIMLLLGLALSLSDVRQKQLELVNRVEI